MKSKWNANLVEINALLEEHERRDALKPLREIFGVKVSENQGATWKLKALCSDCFASIEPPLRAVKEGIAGVRYCDECGCKNAMYKA